MSKTKQSEVRKEGITVRKDFTSTIARLRRPQSLYGAVTNETYKGLFGGNAKLLRERKGLPKTANLRANMSDNELRKVQMAELFATMALASEGASLSEREIKDTVWAKANAVARLTEGV